MTENSSKRYKPVFDEELCMGCGNCQDSCNAGNRRDCLILKNGIMCLLDEEKCLAEQPDCDYKCAKLCPNHAIKLTNLEVS
ncbi:MAG: ATP-binding protein [Candidatus Hodarchaeota archaeon]